MRGDSDFVGQAEARCRIEAISSLYAVKGLPVEHLLFVGPEGSGKLKLAFDCIAKWDTCFHATTCSDLREPSDLTAILTNVQARHAVILEGINDLSPKFVPILSEALSEGTLTIRIGQGAAARTHRLALKPFTLIATAALEVECPSRLRPFLTIIRLSGYTRQEASEITAHLAKRAGLSLTPDACKMVGQAGQSSPGEIERILLKLERLGEKSLDADRISDLFAKLGIRVDPGLGQPAERTSAFAFGLDFERLIASLLLHMGFRAETTRCSGDGGIDIVAFLDSPITGGKFLIQCKRYTDGQVGAPAVRDFYGAVSADRQATKGIVISTSGFTAQAQEFASSVGVELIDGQSLSRLLEQFGLRNPLGVRASAHSHAS